VADNAPASAGGTLRSVNTNGALTSPGTRGSPGQSTTPPKTQGASCISHKPPGRTPPHGPNTIRFGQPAAANPEDPTNDTDPTLPFDSGPGTTTSSAENLGAAPPAVRHHHIHQQGQRSDGWC
jgi:hypothetical protein